jgi:hypothetical protein
VWRVGATRGRVGDRLEGDETDDQPDDTGADEPPGRGDKRQMEGNRGVFDLSFDWSVGHWQLARAHD